MAHNVAPAGTRLRSCKQPLPVSTPLTLIAWWVCLTSPTPTGNTPGPQLPPQHKSLLLCLCCCRQCHPELLLATLQLLQHLRIGSVTVLLLTLLPWLLGCSSRQHTHFTGLLLLLLLCRRVCLQGLQLPPALAQLLLAAQPQARQTRRKGRGKEGLSGRPTVFKSVCTVKAQTRFNVHQAACLCMSGKSRQFVLRRMQGTLSHNPKQCTPPVTRLPPRTVQP